MADAEIQEKVRELRERVDEVDRELIEALSERARIVQEIMVLKAEAGAPVYDPRREEEILRRSWRSQPRSDLRLLDEGHLRAHPAPHPRP